MLIFAPKEGFPVSSNNTLMTKSIRTIDIDCHLKGRRSVIDYFSEALESPYKGDNWDGFQEVITDLGWLNCKKIVVLHHSLPSLSEEETLIYISSLDYASECWDRFDELSKRAIEEYTLRGVFIPEDCWVNHKLSMDIFFREDDRPIVEHNIQLARLKWGYPYRY
ncbi:MAG: hypothetical protein IJK20_00290 [Bacteroidales bacterium]|nr:hypothetical protein [Bacteroidales bacterium]